MSVQTTAFLGILALGAFCLSATAAPIKQINVNGTTVAYVEEGQGDPVVLVHGSLGDYRTWNGEMDAFAERYHVISYSLRYHYPIHRIEMPRT